MDSNTVLDGDVLTALLGQRDVEILSLRSQLAAAVRQIAEMESRLAQTGEPVADGEVDG